MIDHCLLQVAAADAVALEKKLAAMTGGDAYGGKSRKGLRRWADSLPFPHEHSCIAECQATKQNMSAHPC